MMRLHIQACWGQPELQFSHVWILSAGVRDYIHVVDLAKGHIAALKKLKEGCGCKVGQMSNNKSDVLSLYLHTQSSTEILFVICAGLQSGNGERLLGAADGESHGESFREGGEFAKVSRYVHVTNSTFEFNVLPFECSLERHAFLLDQSIGKKRLNMFFSCLVH